VAQIPQVKADESGDNFYRVVAVDPPPVFFEDFESGAEGWVHSGEADNWELGAPNSGPSEAFSGDNVFATGLDANLEPFTDSYLRSPVIDLSGKTVQVTLTFHEFRKIDPEISFHRASVVILDAETKEVIEEPFESSGETNGWLAQSIRLKPDSLNRKVLIEFRMSTDDFNLQEGWFLDDFKLVAE
jgi:bacillopeptidase F